MEKRFENSLANYFLMMIFYVIVAPLFLTGTFIFSYLVCQSLLFSIWFTGALTSWLTVSWFIFVTGTLKGGNQDDGKTTTINQHKKRER